jgi:hypothetical protein
MATTRKRVTAGLLAMGLSASIGLMPVAASAGPHPQGRPDGVELVAHMHSTHAYPHARGFAKYEANFGNRRESSSLSGPRSNRSHHVKREFSVRLWGLRHADGKRLIVRVDGDFVGKMTVSDSGTASLERHHNLPFIRSGDSVRVSTKGGTLVSKGTLFRVHRHDHQDSNNRAMLR